MKQQTKSLWNKARRQVGNTGPVTFMRAATGRQIGSYTDIKATTSPVAAVEPTQPETAVCDHGCGKTVRVKKDGTLYSHKCVA